MVFDVATKRQKPADGTKKKAFAEYGYVGKSVKLRREDQRIVADLEKKLGVDFAQLVRMGIRKLAEHEGVAIA